MLRYTVLNLPPLPPPPSPNMGCGGGDRSCRKKNKESPPWVCEKCAKKFDENGRRLQGTLGCPKCEAEAAKRRNETEEATLDLGCMERPPGAPDETTEATLDLGRHDIGCPNAGRAPEGSDGETSEATLDLGCDKCQKGKKRRQAAAQAFQNSMPAGWLNLQGPMLRQVPLIGDGRGGRSVPYSHSDEEEYPYPYGIGGFGQNGNGMLGQVPISDIAQKLQDAGERISACQGFADMIDSTKSTLDNLGAQIASLNQQIRDANAAGDTDTVNSLFTQLNPLQMSWYSAKTNYDQVSASYDDCLKNGPIMSGARRPAGMLGQVRLAGLGNGGRGGRAFTYHDEGDYRYCDPSMELCPLPIVGPVGVGIGKRCNGIHRIMGQAQNYGCPAQGITLDPTLNCQRDARGNAVCSNGMYFPPGCPHTPPEQYFSPGIAPDEVHNGILEAKVPAPRAAGSAGAEGVSAAGGASSSGTNVLPLAAGGIAAVGLLYAILR